MITCNTSELSPLPSDSCHTCCRYRYNDISVLSNDCCNYESPLPFMTIVVMESAVTCASQEGDGMDAVRTWVFAVRRFNTLRTGDADLRFYITTVQDGLCKSAFLTSTCFPCTIHLIMQYIELVSEWSCWGMFIETWPHSELIFRHRASSI